MQGRYFSDTSRDYVLITLPDIISPKDAVIEVGEPAMLKCEVVESNGTLSFSWFKKGSNDSLYNSTGDSAYSEYKFAPESYEETGLYHCEVIVEFDGSSNGPFKSEMASLIVRGKKLKYASKQKVQLVIKKSVFYLTLSMGCLIFSWSWTTHKR